MKLVQNFLKNEQAATAIEYGLIASLISVVIIAAVRGVGSSLNDVFSAINDQL